MKISTMLSLITVLSLGASAGIVTKDGNVGFVDNLQNQKSEVQIDFAHAMPMEMKSIPAETEINLKTLIEMSQSATGKPGSVAGFKGKEGGMYSETIPVEKPGVAPEEYGDDTEDLYAIPYSTSRVDMYGKAFSNKYPYRTVGKLYFNIGSDTYVCSASLIKRGVVVTAAHCVADYGKNTFYKNWTFVPAKRGAKAPYGKWKAKVAWVKSSYLNGTDECAVDGVVCKNDVAVIVLRKHPKAKLKLPGTKTGWLGYAWDGWGFTSNQITEITQLGYPVSHDRGYLMQRNDSLGVAVDNTYAYNTLIGSRMTGGSSGGPWILNFGQVAKLGGGTTLGHDGKSNRVAGVTSWGFTSDAVKIQGASPFTSENIVSLVKSACDDGNGGKIAQCK